MSPTEDTKRILIQTLQLATNPEALTESTRLLGALPELDSMAVVTILTALEENFGFVIDDDEISADTFATLGTLVEFVARKLQQ
jgi:acyl carrier protein